MNKQAEIRYLPLSEVCSQIIDCPHQTPEWLATGVPVIRNFNLVDGQLDFSDAYYVDEETYGIRTRRAVPTEGDIIFSREAPIGNCAIIPPNFRCCLGQRLVLLRTNPKVCSPEYLLAALQSPYVKQQIAQVAKSGSIVSNFNIGDMKDLIIPVIAGNESIAQISNLLNRKLSTNRLLCSELESMAKTLYDYWFVQFDFPDENGKPYRTSGGEMVWNDQLKREIPKGWGVGKIKQLGSIVSGGTPSTKHEEYYCDCGFAWITPNDLSGNEGKMFIGHGDRDVTQTGVDNSSATLMPKGSVLLSTRAPIGYLAISENELSTNQGFKSIVPDAGYSEYYIYYLLQRNIPALEKQGVGTTFKEISKDTLAEFEVLLPNKTIANMFAENITSACELRAKLEKENRELTRLRDWLLPMLMNGQATVTSAEVVLG